MTRIAVTGGSGRLGRTLVADLAAAGHDVVSLDRVATHIDAGSSGAASNAAAPGGIEQIEVDLADADAAARALAASRADALIHLAAIAVPFSAPENVILRTNAGLAMSVLGGAVGCGIRRIVAASSPTVLGYGAPGWTPGRLPLDERTPPAPAHAYALSKLVIEDTMRMLRRSVDDTFRFAAFRPCYVIAPEEWAGAPTQQGHTVRERLDDPALSAPALFNYVDARDVAVFAETLLAGLGEIPNAEVFFVGADDALAREPLADLVPRFFPGAAEAAATLTGSAPAFSTAHARALLGWRPRYSWRDELRAHTSVSEPAQTLDRETAPGPQQVPDSRKDVPAWSSTASSSSP